MQGHWLLCEWQPDTGTWSAWREVDQLEFLMTYRRHGGTQEEIANPPRSAGSVEFNLPTFAGVLQVY